MNRNKVKKVLVEVISNPANWSGNSNYTFFNWEFPIKIKYGIMGSLVQLYPSFSSDQNSYNVYLDGRRLGLWESISKAIELIANELCDSQPYPLGIFPDYSEIQKLGNVKK